MSEPKFWPPMLPADLVGDGYWYVGSPYSKYPAGLEAAHKEIARITGWLLKQGISAFSPIVESHTIVKQCPDLDPLDHAFWLPIYRPMLLAARGLIVVEMSGWELSVGLANEIIEAYEARKPIFHLVP